MKYLLLVAVAALLLWLWRRPSIEKTAPAPVDVNPRLCQQPFVDWLAVLYRDRPDDAAQVLRAISTQVTKRQQYLRPEMVLNWRTGQHFHNDHAFVVSWKDSESFIGAVANMAARFDFALTWREQCQDLPETLMQTAYVQFLQHGAVLYQACAGGDGYALMVVPQQDAADFEAASQRWHLNMRTANQPY